MSTPNSEPQQPRRKGEITGWHALAFFVVFFGIIVAVNLYMARKAITTFGGVVVENSYVASQNYNEWLAEARAQKELGWTETIDRSADQLLGLTVTDALKAPLKGGSVSAVAQHPLGRAPNIDIAFTETTPGHYRATTPLPPGRWQVRFTIRQGGRVKNIVRDMNEMSRNVRR